MYLSPEIQQKLNINNGGIYNNMTKNKPPIINDLSDVVKMFFDEDGKCYVSNSVPYIVILFLSLIAPKGYKIFISTSMKYIDDKSKLLKNGFIKESIDNLGNVFLCKHKLVTPEKKG